MGRNLGTAPTCCGTVAGDALDERAATTLADAFRALADPARVRLLSMIATAPDGEACACDLIPALGRAQATVSHHLAVLVGAGLLTREKRGRWAWFRVVPGRLAELRRALDPAVAVPALPVGAVR